MSESMALHMLATVGVTHQAELQHRAGGNILMEAMKEKLVTIWLRKRTSIPKVLNLLKISDIPSPGQKEVEMDTFRKYVSAVNMEFNTSVDADEYLHKRFKSAQAHQERCPKRQRIDGPSIWR
uniref:Uncharacterized protein n=1 Tax=Peronospora matthiolae TaxID=2874970 RepID=A0AAV1VET5_9STRA